jgi:twitching motility two-component system response regulator PilG
MWRAQGRFRDGSYLGRIFGVQASPNGVRPIRRGHCLVNTNESAMKVLVVDDSNTIRRSAEIFLKQGGHEVLLAEDGFDALSKVNDYQPNLIFCDILMPRLDGYQTCAIIKRNARFSAVPVVMLSSKDGVFDKARGRMAGAQDYLTKPFTKEQLLQAVQQFGVALQGAN